MKILKRPKFKKVTCRVCGCVFVPSDKDIDPVMSGLTTRCPVCKAPRSAVPKKMPKPELKPAPLPKREGGDE